MTSERKLIIIILAASLALYLGIVFGGGYSSSHNKLVYQSVDAKGYKIVADWIWQKSDSTPVVMISIRPFLFPLITGGIEIISGKTGIWCTQAILWISSLYILLKCLIMLKLPRGLIIAGAFIYVSNITGILVTLHGLSETLTIFLLCWYVYFILKKYLQNKNISWQIVLIASLLTVTKPLFQYLLIFTLILIVMDLWKGKDRSYHTPVAVLIALIPVFIQLFVMKQVTGKSAISRIGEVTFREYYFRAVYAAENNMEIENAKPITNPMSNEEMVSFMKAHPLTSLQVYLKMMHKQNLVAGTNLSHLPVRNEVLSKFSKELNKLLFWLHCMALIAILILMFKFIKKKKLQDLEYLLALSCPVYLIILTAGLTFWQGDRIILPALPISVVLYAFTYKKFGELKQKENLPGMA